MKKVNITEKSFLQNIVILMLGLSCLSAVSSGQELSKNSFLKNTGPYCGIYCVYSLNKLYGRNIEITDLIKPEHISSRKGSSISDLERAIKGSGINSKRFSNFTTWDLKRCSYPAILHVKTEVSNDKYDHFVVFLGSKDDKVILFDPPSSLQKVDFHDISLLWDGAGIIVSDKPISAVSVFSGSWIRFFVCGLLIICIILIFRALRNIKIFSMNLAQWKQHIIVASIQGLCLATCVYIIGFTWHFVNDAGFLCQLEAISKIQKTHAGNFVSKITTRSAKRHIGNGAVFIDARLERDYEAGHIKDAISLPVNSSDKEFNSIVSDIPKKSDIVVYCQSPACKFAERIAIRLIDEGYNKAKVYRGGWVEW